MEYLEGYSLREVLKQGVRLDPSSILWLLRGICDVLSTAHHRGFVHRDLKPENIMVATDPDTGARSVRVLDFGIAKILRPEGDAAAPTMQTMGVLGTPAYSSPEQNAVDGDAASRPAVDHRSDVYSLGVILYELLTGKPPFAGAWARLLYLHAHEEPTPPSQAAPHASFPAEVEALVLRCLAKSPDDRPASASKLYNELRAAYGDLAAAELRTTIPGSRSEGAPPPSGSMLTSLDSLTPHPNAAPATSAQAEAAAGRPRTRRAAIGLGLASLAVLASAAAWLLGFFPTVAHDEDRPKPPPPAPEISSDVAIYLRNIGPRSYSPDSDAGLETLGGMNWPRAIALDGAKRRLILHPEAGLYLPEGSEPDTSEGMDESLALPRVAINRILKKPIRFRLIGGGEFSMGSDDEEFKGQPESPGHKVHLNTYYIQESETTIGQVEAYLEYTGSPSAEIALTNYRDAKAAMRIPNLQELFTYPAVALSRKLCEDFAHVLGAELPSEAQWEFAARSRGDRTKYVWEGLEFNVGDANVESLRAGSINTDPVGKHAKDVTRQGVADMAGNVREWCRDVRANYDAAGGVPTDPVTTSFDADPSFAIRGGSYTTPRWAARTVSRPREAQAPNDEDFDDVGFRMVLEVVVARLPESTRGDAPATKKGPGQ
jgi:serine/threonine-protein kinase